MSTRFHFDYLGRKNIWFAISGAIIVAGLLAIFMGGLKFGVEFKGGNQYNVIFKSAPTVAQIRKTMDTLDLGASTIQAIGSGAEFMIRTPRQTNAVQSDIKTALKKDFKVKDISMRDIGPGWGQQVTDGALKALIASLLVILIYISIRFEFKMAVAVIVSLFHDGLVVIGVYALVGLLETKLGLSFIPTEVTPNTVAALLTILGFSLYDTIVVFHRIKENTELIGKRTYTAMANDSINQVIMRSVNTSLTELVPVIALMFFGGETLKDFGFAMLVGLVSGVYSSIFIASPVLAMLKETEPRYRMLKEKLVSTGRLAAKTKARAAATGGVSTGSSEVASPPEKQAPRNDVNVSEETAVITPKMKTASQKAKKKSRKKRKK